VRRRCGRHRAAVQRLPPPPGQDVQRPRQRANIVCPLHRWTYDLKGELIGAPHFGETPCLNLSKTQLQNWNGLLFERNGYDVQARLKNLSVTKDLDFTGYMLDHVEVHECDYNWKTFIEVYLEDYHVEPFHPGLGSFVACDDLRWEFGEDYSVQTVGVQQRPAEVRLARL
jgi:choline monooxygenase